ncbi:MAG: Na(+)/H(+) antiporter subunit D [Planctomycetota bacterium]|nr:Na(+)/H(+) antiporter subunit D [Planctomycetota bacterium]
MSSLALASLAVVPPAVYLIVGAILLAVVPRTVRRPLSVLVAAVTLACVAGLEKGAHEALSFWGGELQWLDVDALSLVFGWIFALTILVWTIYAWHLKGRLELVSAFLYGGGALGVVFAGDLLTLFLYWELMAIASTGVILAAGTTSARKAAMRYVCVHFTGGVLLLFGIAIHAAAQGGDLTFGAMELDGAGPWLILLGFAINAAMPPFSAWLPDAYPEGSPSGSVFLSAFTTKTSVYVLATAFAGTDLLIGMGAFMSLYGIFYALNENDARRVLSYSIMNQVGFMICGIGIGTPLAINGVAAHAFCHILYKSLLFMSAGAVLYRTGRSKCTELGGLWRTMPWTLVFGLVGALSISAMPLTNGFISKPMIVGAAAAGMADSTLLWVAYLVLMVASAGVSLHAGIKFPWFVFFAEDKGLRPKEAPFSMLLAMGIVSFLCIGLGCYPKPLYDLLPTDMATLGFQAYTLDHVVLQLEVLVASGFAFFLLLPVLKRTPTITLDTDWFYRKGAPRFVAWVAGPLMGAFGWLSRSVHETVPRGLRYFAKNPGGAARLAYDRFLLGWAGAFRSMEAIDRAQARLQGDQGRYEATSPGAAWPIGTTVLYSAVAFLIFLLTYLF